MTNDAIINMIFDLESKGHLKTNLLSQTYDNDKLKVVKNFNVYFLDTNILFAINRFPVDFNNDVLSSESKDKVAPKTTVRKWGFQYFDPNSCQQENNIAIKQTITSDKPGSGIYRFNFVSELKFKVFKNKYALRNRLSNLLYDSNTVKMPSVIHTIQNDKIFKKIIKNQPKSY